MQQALETRQSSNLGNVPDEIKQLSQWVCWKAESRGKGKIAKLPINPTNNKYAKTNDPSIDSICPSTISCGHR